MQVSNRRKVYCSLNDIKTEQYDWTDTILHFVISGDTLLFVKQNGYYEHKGVKLYIKQNKLGTKLYWFEYRSIKGQKDGKLKRAYYEFYGKFKYIRTPDNRLFCKLLRNGCNIIIDSQLSKTRCKLINKYYYDCIQIELLDPNNNLYRLNASCKRLAVKFANTDENIVTNIKPIYLYNYFRNTICDMSECKYLYYYVKELLADANKLLIINNCGCRSESEINKILRDNSLLMIQSNGYDNYYNADHKLYDWISQFSIDRFTDYEKILDQLPCGIKSARSGICKT